jgi:hypothetical protein
MEAFLSLLGKNPREFRRTSVFAAKSGMAENTSSKDRINLKSRIFLISSPFSM